MTAGKNDHVVVWDPTGFFWEGSLIDATKARALEAQGGIALECRPELFKLAGVAGYHRRAWGAGWPLDFLAPRMSCPLTLYVLTQHRRLHWCARLVPETRSLAAAREGKPFDGMLRVVGDSAGHGHHASLTQDSKPVDMRALGKLDVRDGWTIRGDAALHPSVDGYYGFGLYGTAPGVRVAWAALTVT